MGIDDCGRTEVLTVGPEHRAARGAGSTQDALGGVVVASPILWGLQPLLGGSIGCHQEGIDVAVGLVEGLHVDNQVLLNWKPLDWLDVNGVRNV